MDQVVMTACKGCGHRSALHGLYLRETWCIAWDDVLKRFCGCQTYIAEPAA